MSGDISAQSPRLLETTVPVSVLPFPSHLCSGPEPWHQTACVFLPLVLSSLSRPGWCNCLLSSTLHLVSEGPLAPSSFRNACPLGCQVTQSSGPSKQACACVSGPTSSTPGFSLSASATENCLTLKQLYLLPLSSLSFLPGALYSLCLSGYLLALTHLLRDSSAISSSQIYKVFSTLVQDPLPQGSQNPWCFHLIRASTWLCCDCSLVCKLYEMVTQPGTSYEGWESFVHKYLEEADLGLMIALCFFSYGTLGKLFHLCKPVSSAMWYK